MIPQRPHHRLIWDIISQFNAPYLTQNNILFGGGTRIALELFEYRESIDIDFLCADPKSYKAVRNQITADSLGALVNSAEQFSFPRGIRADRDAVRTFIEYQNKTIKLEFVHFDYYQLQADTRTDLFPVPSIDQEGCFLTKLLANADRYAEPTKKDIVDLCMMHNHWGQIPKGVWQKAEEKYGLKSVYHGLNEALSSIINDAESFQIVATLKLGITPETAGKIVTTYAPNLLQSILAKK